MSTQPTPSIKLLKLHSPLLTTLLKARPAPVRESALLAAATSTSKPVKPAAGDCCGSSCDPCVMDLYAQELKVWKECKALREVVAAVTENEGEAEEVGKEDRGGGVEGCKVPGAFEW